VLAREPCIDVADAILRGLVEILPRAECALAGAGDDDCTHGLVLVQFAQQGDQGFAHRDVDGVQYFRPVEYDERHGLPPLELDAVSHAAGPCTQT
jgi:hypothetical protein